MRSCTSFRYLRWRTEQVARLGGKCVRCGFADFRALQFDHIKGGQGRNRPTGWKRQQALQAQINNGDIQLLCANCNFIKRYDSPLEQGGTITRESHLADEKRKAILVLKLDEGGFIPPENRRISIRCTRNTLPPAILAVLQMSSMELTASEISYALTHFGWKFGSGAVEYDMGAMTIRNALTRRRDLFVPLGGGRFTTVPFLPHVNELKLLCPRVSCSHIWYSYTGTIPPNCPKCKRRLEDSPYWRSH